MKREITRASERVYGIYWREGSRNNECAELDFEFDGGAAWEEKKRERGIHLSEENCVM